MDLLQEYAKERIDSYFELKAELVGVEIGVKRKVTELDWAEQVAETLLNGRSLASKSSFTCQLSITFLNIFIFMSSQSY